jgi:hypothetical protein
MLFKCKYCTSPTAPGHEVCNRPLCRERDTILKCEELGMTYKPPFHRIVHDVGPP